MRITRVLLLGIAACLVFANPASAQFSSTYDEVDAADVNDGEAIPVGPFLFSPAAQISWQRRDNIHFTPDNEVTDDVYLARLRLLFELPVYESYVRFSYTPHYRMYQDYDYEENWGHYFDIAGEFEFSNGLRLGAAYKYISTAMETREVDAGGELMPGEDRHIKNFGELSGQYWFTETDAIHFEGAYEDLRWKDEYDTFFYPYNRIRLGAGWYHQLNPTLRMELNYRHQIFDSEDTLSYRDSTSDQLTLGFDGQINDVLGTGIQVGYRKTDQDLADGDPDISDYSSFIVRGHLTWELAHGSNLRLDLIRSDYPSNYDTNAYYTATGASVIYDLSLENFYAQARVRLQNNDYELQDTWYGETRSDDILTAGLALGFRFTEYLSLRGTYLWEDRDTIYAYSYETNILTLSLVVGY